MAYLNINVPSILPRLLEIAQSSLDALADHSGVARRFARQGGEDFGQPLGWWGLVGEGLHQSAETEDCGVASEHKAVLLLGGS